MSQTSETELQQELEAKLRETRDHWQRRLQKIQSHRRHEDGPLDPDFEEQAVERENDGTLDALDARGRQELEAVEAALARIEAGTFGRCVTCDETIDSARLRARPTAGRCIECAEEAASATARG